ncbi:MAG: acetate--CoA ligase family protein [Euryarchaeota archaeon]|nr:acetate--CoA ligase family protein [Euryarchaeota archaeon]
MVAKGADGLPALFSPRSIAVIGASRRAGSVGASMFQNILGAGFTGVVYPVNPSWESVGGVRCYPKVASLPEVPDLAVVIVPAPAVEPTVEELGRRGTRAAIVISAGFKEIGGEGVEREHELVATARRWKVRLVGPNCFGVINTDPEVRLNATFSDTLPPPGNIAFVSQSGALGAGILHYAQVQRIGFTKFVSVGNRAGIDENDLLAALADDERTRVILLYVESLAAGRRFLEVAEAATKRKPVLCIKSGRTPQGAAAALSHTGSLARAQSDRLYDGLFLQSRVLRASSLAELFQMAKVFASAPDLGGSRLAILTNSGGPAILAADAAPRAGLSLASLPEHRQERLRRFLSPNASVRNPVDMTADATPETYARALRELLGDTSVDQVLAIATPTGTSTGLAIAKAWLDAWKERPKPTVACLFGVEDLSEEVALLESGGIPNFTFPEEGVRALGRWAEWQDWKRRVRKPPPTFQVERAKARRLLERARHRGQRALGDYEAREVLRCYGFKIPEGGLVHNEREARALGERIGYPLVLKVVSPDILHKTDVGGVALGLRDAASVAAALRGMQQRLAKVAPTSRVEGFLLERMVEGGRELILGVQRDPEFGPVIVFGMGGIYVEVLKDVSFRLVPITQRSAEHMVEGTLGYRLLQGVRGEPPADLGAVHEALLRLSQFAREQELVGELDINPLLALPSGKGAVAVDCRIGLVPPPARPSSRSARRSSTGR